jgi:hypothetical protein
MVDSTETTLTHELFETITDQTLAMVGSIRKEAKLATFATVS